MNKLVLNFTPCSPAPPGGYNVLYRLAGSGASYTNAGNFFISPAVFYDTLNPAGSCYEGFIRSVSGNLVCNAIPWSSCDSDSVTGDPTVNITGTITHSARGVFVDIVSPLPCDVTFPIDGKYDNAGTLTDFTVNITITAGNVFGSDLTAIPGPFVIDCIRPTTAGTSSFVYSSACPGVNYLFILEIDIPC